jgi:hypothetical protein
MSTRAPAARVNRAVEMIRVFQAAHHPPGLSVRTLPDPTAEEVSDLLHLVIVELVAGAEVTPGSHGPRCWRLPGHHRCAIEALLAAEGRAA